MVMGKIRKTDRRTLYTKMVIKDALLALMKKKVYEEITVTSICQQAEITRATFYLHFADLRDVLDEILGEVFTLTEDNQNMSITSLEALRHLVNGKADAKTMKENEFLLPSCHRIADESKYRVLFFDQSISGYIVNKLFESKKNQAVLFLQDYCHMKQDEAEMLFCFLIHGSFYVNKVHGWKKDEAWYRIQQKLMLFALGGFDALKAKKV
jgi:AcrR family transcriptional regulator